MREGILQVLCAVVLLAVASGHVSAAASEGGDGILLWKSGGFSSAKSSTTWICHYKAPGGQGELVGSMHCSLKRAFCAKVLEGG